MRGALSLPGTDLDEILDSGAYILFWDENLRDLGRG